MTAEADRDWRQVVELAMAQEAFAPETVNRPAPDPDAPMFASWAGTPLDEIDPTVAELVARVQRLEGSSGTIDLTDGTIDGLIASLSRVERRFEATVERVEELLAEDRATLNKRLASYKVQLATLEEQLARVLAVEEQLTQAIADLPGALGKDA